MDKTGTRQATPVLNDPNIESEPWLDFSSGYVQRALDKLPRQGTKAPWKVYQNYALDLVALKFGTVEDGVMQFTNKASEKKTETPVKEKAAA